MKTNILRTFSVGMAVLVLVAAAGLPAVAHHSFSIFNTTTEQTITGTVKEVQWTNPHIFIWVDVKNDKGTADTYGFEGMSPNFLERRNWTRTTLKVGDEITVSFNPLRDGKKGGMFRTGRMKNGTVLNMGGATQ